MKERSRLGLRARRQPDPEVQVVDSSTLAVLRALPMQWLIVTSGFAIDESSPQAGVFGLTERGRLSNVQVKAEVTLAVRSGENREFEFEVDAKSVASSRTLKIRICPLAEDRAVILLDDISQPLLVDAMRRDFIVNVSHELKTPVGAMLLLAEAAKSSSQEPESLERFLDRMQTEAERMSRLINDLTDLSRLQSAGTEVQHTPVPLHRLFAESLDSVRLVASRNQVDLIAGDTLGLEVDGDEDQLVTALRNLLLNAITYSPAGTRVSLTASPNDEYLDLLVSDQGIGIAEADQGRIFERFYRVDPARSRATGGTGLGLSIVKHIAGAHAGDCLVWSKPNEGSTFTLRLRSGHRDTAVSEAQPRD